MGTADPVDGRTQSEIQVGPDKLQVVASFCYLGDMLPTCRGCVLAITTRLKTARELNYHFSHPATSHKTHGYVYSSPIQSYMLHASETWPLTKTNLQCNDRAMIRQICMIKPEDVATVRSNELLAKLELEDLDFILRERRLCWFGHVECSSGTVITACWQAGAREAQANLEETDMNGSSRQLTLKKGALGDQVCDLLCMQLASYLTGGPLM